MDLLLQLDGNILLWIQEFLRQPWLTPLVALYTKLGDGGMLWIALSLLLLCFPRTRRAGIVSLLAMALGLLCTNVVLKHLVARARPWVTVEGLAHLVTENDPNSFPSGHTTAAFASALAWWHTLPGRQSRMAGLCMAVLMGLSRLYVGVHFPSDVLVGAAVGAACGILAWQIAKRVKPDYFLEG